MIDLSGEVDRKERLLTLRQVSELLNVHPSTVRVWNKKRFLRYYRLGTRGDRRFKLSDVEEFVGMHKFRKSWE